MFSGSPRTPFTVKRGFEVANLFAPDRFELGGIGLLVGFELLGGAGNGFGVHDLLSGSLDSRSRFKGLKILPRHLVPR